MHVYKGMVTTPYEYVPNVSIRLARKARINIQDNLADALLQTWTSLKTVASDDFQDDDEIKVYNTCVKLILTDVG